MATRLTAASRRPWRAGMAEWPYLLLPVLTICLLLWLWRETRHD